VQRHIDPSAVATAGMRAGSPVLEAYQEHSAIPAGSPALRELGEKVHCHHGAANCPRTTVQVVFAECPPSNGEEHFSGTRCSRSGLRDKFMLTQSLECRKNTMRMLLVALRLCLAFFGLGDPGLFHYEDCCLVSGSYP